MISTDKKILVIDDSLIDRKILGSILEKKGFNIVRFAKTGHEGIEQAKDLRPEIILLDVVLPDMDGFDVCKEIKSLQPQAKILMITSHLDVINAQNAVKSGANEIIQKPVRLEGIMENIERVIGEN